MRKVRCVLSIAGSDSGGGAGIQADLKTFAAYGLHGVSAITCITAQNPREVTGIQAMKPSMVSAQIEAVMEDLQPGAAKTGMLFSAGIIRAVARCLSKRPSLALVLDPVMIATSGATLMERQAYSTLCDQLIPLARVVTPNLNEAQSLTGIAIRSLDDMRTASRVFHERFQTAVIVKGGHLTGAKVPDLLWDGDREVIEWSARIQGIATHGTGCTFSAALAAGLALGWPLKEAFLKAKSHVNRALRGTVEVGKHHVLHPFGSIEKDARVS